MTLVLLDDVTPRIEDGLARWRRLLVELIRIPSLFEHEHAIIARVAEHLATIGCLPSFVAHDRARLAAHPRAQQPFSTREGRGSLALRLKGTGGGRSLALNTHLDVVASGRSAGWTHPPFSGHVDEERDVVYGRGAVDNKAGVVIALAVLELLAHGGTPLAGDVVFHFVLEDETTGNGTLLCLEDGYSADAAVIIDGTRPGRAIDRHCGHTQLELLVTGKAASISVAHAGVNAAETLAALLLELKKTVHGLNAATDAPWNRFPSPFSFVTQAMSSRSETLTLPESAEARAWMTFPPPATLARMRAHVEEAIRRFAPEIPDAKIEVVWSGFATEPVHSESGPLAEALIATAEQLGLGPIEIGPSTGISDMRHFTERGVPCLMYGPGTGYNPHRPDESYHLGDLPWMIAFYVALARRWCSLPAVR